MDIGHHLETQKRASTRLRPTTQSGEKDNFFLTWFSNGNQNLEVHIRKGESWGRWVRGQIIHLSVFHLTSNHRFQTHSAKLTKDSQWCCVPRQHRKLCHPVQERLWPRTPGYQQLCSQRTENR